MDISKVITQATPPDSSTPTTDGPKPLGKDDFLKLLVTVAVREGDRRRQPARPAHEGDVSVTVTVEIA